MSLLKLSNIGKIYNSNDILTIGIRGVNLELDYNEFVTIEGESGSGKSTLLNVIGANDSYEEGEFYVNGEETSHYSESDWEKYRAHYIATVFQDFNIIENLTVMENVELALLRIADKGERRKIASELIKKVGLTKQRNQKGSRLSGGEKQRTVIARALAKDAPIILADEPTGNLDVKASREIAALLKEVSKDKLVIVVTHNPEFFVEYATRRIHIFDGSVASDEVISAPQPEESHAEEQPVQSKRQAIKNTLHIGVLNYKSRPRFTVMMTFALFICAITLYIVLEIFNNSLISSLTSSLEDYPTEGKVIISCADGTVNADSLDEISYATHAGYSFIDRDLSSFDVDIPRKSGMRSSYTVRCLYAPYEYNLGANEGVLSIPVSSSSDAEAIRSVFLNAGVGLSNITIKKNLSNDGIKLYLGSETLTEYGVNIKAINSTVKLGNTERTVYRFEEDESLASGEVSLVNSNFYDAVGNTIIFSVKSNRSYTVVSDSEKQEDVSGVIVRLSTQDYADIFTVQEEASQSCLYFSSDEVALAATSSLPSGYMGVLSSSRVYKQNAGDVFASDVLYYIALIAISLCFAMLICVIFIRSVRVYRTDFAVYRTLGISSKIASRSLYIQMALIFLPTLIFLPLASLCAALIPGGSMALISVGDYIFIEVMMLLIVECVAYGFNKTIKGQSIRKSLKRGSK